MSLMSRFCITGLFFGYFEFILACFFGSDWYIFSITQFRAHQGQRYNSVNPHRKGWLWLLTFNWLSWFHPSLKRFDPHRSLDSSSYDILFVSVEFHFIMTSGVFLPPLSSPPPSWLILHQLTYRISGSSSWMAMQLSLLKYAKSSVHRNVISRHFDFGCVKRKKENHWQTKLVFVYMQVMMQSVYPKGGVIYYHTVTMDLLGK